MRENKDHFYATKNQNVSRVPKSTNEIWKSILLNSIKENAAFYYLKSCLKIRHEGIHYREILQRGCAHNFIVVLLKYF